MRHVPALSNYLIYIQAVTLIFFQSQYFANENGYNYKKRSSVMIVNHAFKN